MRRAEQTVDRSVRWLTILAVLASSAWVAVAQHTPLPAPANPAASATNGAKPGIDVPAGTTKAQAAKELRDVQIAADTEKLCQLAQELKVEMDKSTKDTLSLSVIRKATEMERLAHSLKERLKTGS